MLPSPSNISFSQILEFPFMVNSKELNWTLCCSVLGRKRWDTYSPLLVFPSSQCWGGDFYCHDTIHVILPLTNSSPRRGALSNGELRTKNYTLKTSTLLQLFLFGICLHSQSVIDTGLHMESCGYVTACAWLDGPIQIQDLGLGSSFLLYIKGTFSSISFASNTNVI